MTSPKLLSACLQLLAVTGIAAAGRSMFQGRGAITCLHQVLPGGGRRTDFAPNHQLELDSSFLDECLSACRTAGFRFLSLDAALDELTSGQAQSSPFLVFTLDDGYRDNLQHAVPVFRKHACPYAIFVSPRMADGTCEIWWKLLEFVIAKTDRLLLRVGGQEVDLSTADNKKKQHAYDILFPMIKNMDEYEQRKWMRSVCREHNVDPGKICRDMTMNWDELRILVDDPLCTIGAHTLNHYALSKLSGSDCLHELVMSRERIAQELKRDVKFFAYPYGDVDEAGPRDFLLAKEAGYRAAFTTRKGMIFSEHAKHIHALPRLMLSGRYQSLRHVNTLLTGTPFAFLNRFQKINVGGRPGQVATSSE
jgi:peptidoglycan/xylan/chitin deacetylase (PgdA/CDA1 family)